MVIIHCLIDSFYIQHYFYSYSTSKEETIGVEWIEDKDSDRSILRVDENERVDGILDEGVWTVERRVE